MHVQVVRLRREGVKLDSEEISRMPPDKGHLRFSAQMGAAHLSPTVYTGSGFIADVIPPMVSARVKSIDQRGMVIVGSERTGMYAMGPKYPQAWWVRPLGQDVPP